MLIIYFAKNMSSVIKKYYDILLFNTNSNIVCRFTGDGETATPVMKFCEFAFVMTPI